MKKLTLPICLLLCLFLLFSLSACHDTDSPAGGEAQGGSTEDSTQNSTENGTENGDENESAEGGTENENADKENDSSQNEDTDMLILNQVPSPVTLAKPITTAYLSAAREAYRTPAYANYSTSLISSYKTTSGDQNDMPASLTLSFSGVENAVSYMLELSLSSDFTESTRRYFLGKETSLAVSNLYTGATYFWRVSAFLEGGKTVTSATATFQTEQNAVRWIAVDGARNVRDIGGWTGLKQGMVYRGSELNAVDNHGLAITEEGRRTLREELGIKTDLDFRAAADNGGSKSHIGADVLWVNRPIGGFLSAFTDEYRLALREFANPENYPIYMHCWGGADRTGTVAMLIEGLCGVSEEDLAADLELTSFSVFGYRYRYDNGAYLYASTIAKIKTDYTGNTLKEKFESYALSLGLTRAEISNIQSLLSGNGACFANNSLQNICIDTQSGEEITLTLQGAAGLSVTGVHLGDAPLSFRFDGTTLSLSKEELLTTAARLSLERGTLTLTFGESQSIKTDISFTKEPTLAEKIVQGNLSLLFNDQTAAVSDGSVEKASGSLTFTHTVLRALKEAGYTAISFRASAELTDTVSATDTRIRLLARWKSGSSYLSGNKQDLTAVTLPATVAGTVTIHLSEEFLGEGNVFTLIPQSGGNITLSDFAFIK